MAVNTVSDTSGPPPASSLGDTPSATGDVEKKSTDSSSLERGPEEAPVEDTTPGAKAGLTLKQFWIVMFGYVYFLV